MKTDMFDIRGMTCSVCSRRVYKSVSNLAGVSEANVNFLKNSMRVTFDDAVLSAADIVAAVTKAGYGASVRGANTGKSSAASDDNTASTELMAMKHRVLVSFLFSVPLFYISMGHMMGWPLPAFLLGAENALPYALTQFFLTLPVVFVNAGYYRKGFTALFSGAPNMDSLIAIGSGAAVVFGVYAIYRMAFALGLGDFGTVHHFAMNLYFESAAMILTLITFGKFLETRAKGKTSEAITKLMNLAPKTATVVRDGSELVIPREEIVVDDILVVKAGESIPVDGVITEGSGVLDESALTGESLPVGKHVSDAVSSATINQSGHFLMRATRVGDDTTLAQIVRLVDEATSSKAPVARLADKISGIFVPVVIVIAVLSVLVWLLLGYGIEFALSIGIAVLVISCPCALGLATPTAIMVGTGRGAASGILLKSAEAIETAGRIDTVVLDKTGTVTEGKPVVTDTLPIHPVSEDELLALAASLEKLSEHPLGAAIVREAESRGIALRKANDFRQIPGQGIAGSLDGAEYIAGNAKMLEAGGVANTLLVTAERLAAEGKTPLYLAKNTELLGIVAVADVIKKSSRQAVAELEAMGIDVIMLTGDNARTAQAVGRQAGIAKVVAEVLPQDKEREIRILQERGKKVAMVGDGINDAPALARADVGIAIGAGTDIAIESADIVLMKSDLLDAVSAIQLSQAVMRNIKQNLFWAFFYNSIGIPVAAGVLYGTWGIVLNPMIAAAAMSLSSVSVVSNALRLRLFVPKHSIIESSRGEKCDAGAGTVVTGMSNTTKTREHKMKKVIRIEGMNCGHCSASVTKALGAIAGVTQADVDLAAKTATVMLGEDIADDVLRKAIVDAGFSVVDIV